MDSGLGLGGVPESPKPQDLGPTSKPKTTQQLPDALAKHLLGFTDSDTRKDLATGTKTARQIHQVSEQEHRNALEFMEKMGAKLYELDPKGEYTDRIAGMLRHVDRLKWKQGDTIGKIDLHQILASEPFQLRINQFEKILSEMISKLPKNDEAQPKILDIFNALAIIPSPELKAKISQNLIKTIKEKDLRAELINVGNQINDDTVKSQLIYLMKPNQWAGDEEVAFALQIFKLMPMNIEAQSNCMKMAFSLVNFSDRIYFNQMRIIFAVLSFIENLREPQQKVDFMKSLLSINGVDDKKTISRILRMLEDDKNKSLCCEVAAKFYIENNNVEKSISYVLLNPDLNIRKNLMKSIFENMSLGDIKGKDNLSAKTKKNIAIINSVLSEYSYSKEMDQEVLLMTFAYINNEFKNRSPNEIGLLKDLNSTLYSLSRILSKRLTYPNEEMTDLQRKEFFRQELELQKQGAEKFFQNGFLELMLDYLKDKEKEIALM
ncbi:MAG: hypothetical protein H0W88_00480 [Parachlamydiaceae bacterium]|nr:hypothetical protein [Parachlamydiaceae bacterium]